MSATSSIQSRTCEECEFVFVVAERAEIPATAPGRLVVIGDDSALVEQLRQMRYWQLLRWVDGDRAKGEIVPTLTGTAHVTGESLLRLDPKDPFCWGIRS